MTWHVVRDETPVDEPAGPLRVEPARARSAYHVIDLDGRQHCCWLAGHAPEDCEATTPPAPAEATPCEHDGLGCGSREEHDPHTKLGDGRPCCGWPPRCDAGPAAGDPEPTQHDTDHDDVELVEHRRRESGARVTVRFPDPLFQRLRRASYEQDRPMVSIMREALDLYLDGEAAR